MMMRIRARPSNSPGNTIDESSRKEYGLTKRIKICGITRVEDLSASLDAGVDAVGFVFYPPSKRCLSLEAAHLLGRQVPAFVTSVALFVNPDRQSVLDVQHALRPSLLQFHGDESADFCRDFDLPYLKAFRVGSPGMDTPEALAQSCMMFSDAAGWLFDSYSPAYGGSGQRVDLDLLERALRLVSDARPLVLSGGLDSTNVLAIVRRIQPWAVDVSSGVESSPGVKSYEKIRAFVHAVKMA